MSDASDDIVFLPVEVVLALHQRQLERFGGGAGLRDRGLLESAVAQPQASFAGTLAHDGVVAMAAAYLYHIVSNHPFVALSPPHPRTPVLVESLVEAVHASGDHERARALLRELLASSLSTVVRRAREQSTAWYGRPTP